MVGDSILTRFHEYVASKGLAADNIWFEIRGHSRDLIPEMVNAYRSAKKADVRIRMLFHCIRWARDSAEAFALGIEGLSDRSSLARYRACMVLAYSLNDRALPYLRALAGHPDEKTAADAVAAIASIESRNHNLFVDRDGSGSTFWSASDAS